MQRPTLSALMRASSIIAIASAVSVPAQAQDSIDLGTLIFGQTKRDIQTQTATTETVIDQEELDDRQGSTIAELVDTVPGVTLVNGSSPAGSAINIRGVGAQAGIFGTDSKVDIIVDGVGKGAEEIYRYGTQLISEPELYKEVTVIRGPGGITASGSGAIGGTVELKTKDASDFTDGEIGFVYRGKAGYESNSNGVLSSHILAWQPTEKTEFLGAYVIRNFENSEDGDGEEQIDTAFRAPSYLLKGRFALGENSEHAIIASYQYTENPENDVDYNAFNPGSFATLVDRFSRNTTAILAYEYAPIDNDLVNLRAQLSYSDENAEISSNVVTSDIFNADHITERTTFSVENESLFTTGSVDHRLNVGIEFGKESRSSDDGTGTGENGVSAPGGDKDIAALYITDEMQIGDRLTVTPGLRFERQTITSENNNTLSRGVAGPADGTEFEASGRNAGLTMRYQVSDPVAVFGTVAYSEGLPIFDDLRSSTNREKTEKATSFELGVNYDKESTFTDGDTFTLEAVVFRNRIWDITTYRGVDEVAIRGLEFEASYAHPSDWYLDFNAAFLRGTDVGADSYFEQVPGDQLRLTLGKRFMEDQLDVSLETVHYRANDRTDSTSTFSVGTLPVDSETVFNFTTAYRPKSGALEGTEIVFGIDNVTDVAYQPYLSTRNIPGRNIKLSIAKTF